MTAQTAKLLTTAGAAQFMGYDNLSTMRTVQRFALERGFSLQAPEELWPDRRTPMYDQNLLAEYRDFVRPARLWSLPEEERSARLAAHREETRNLEM